MERAEAYREGIAAAEEEFNVRAWVDGLKKSDQQVSVKRWGISAGLTAKYICAASREIARQMGGIIEEFQGAWTGSASASRGGGLGWRRSRRPGPGSRQ